MKSNMPIKTSDQIVSMNEKSNDSPSQQEDVETFTAWLKRNSLDEGQPWLFYGEDELFKE